MGNLHYAGLVLYFLDVTFRLTQWGVTSGVQCQFVSADKTFVTIRLKYNKVLLSLPTAMLIASSA